MIYCIIINDLESWVRLREYIIQEEFILFGSLIGHIVITSEFRGRQDLFAWTEQIILFGKAFE